MSEMDNYLGKSFEKKFNNKSWYDIQNQGRSTAEFKKHLYLGKLAEEYVSNILEIEKPKYNVDGKDGYDLYYHGLKINVKYTEYNSFLFSKKDDIFQQEQVFIGLKIIYKDNNKNNIKPNNITFDLICLCDSDKIKKHVRKPVKTSLEKTHYGFYPNEISEI